MERKPGEQLGNELYAPTARRSGNVHALVALGVVHGQKSRLASEIAQLVEDAGRGQERSFPLGQGGESIQLPPEFPCPDEVLTRLTAAPASRVRSTELGGRQGRERVPSRRRKELLIRPSRQGHGPTPQQGFDLER